MTATSRRQAGIANAMAKAVRHPAPPGCGETTGHARHRARLQVLRPRRPDRRSVRGGAGAAAPPHEETESIPVRLSHIALNSPNLTCTRARYEQLLGFRLSDTLTHPAIAKAPHAAVHHVSFELRGIDEYMRGAGRLLRAGVAKILGPG